MSKPSDDWKPLSFPVASVPSMSSDEMDELAILLLHLPELLEPARMVLKYEQLRDEFYWEFAILWLARERLAEKGVTPDTPGYIKRIESFLKNTLQRSIIDPSNGQAAQTLLEEGGLIQRAAETDRRNLDPQRGLELLRQFAEELLVIVPLKKALPRDAERPHDLKVILDGIKDRAALLESLYFQQLTPVGELIEEHEARLGHFRGREYSGLITGMYELDRRTLGLRGLFLLGAMPGVGKTTLCLQMALGVCVHHAYNDAIVVFLSLEMDRWQLMTRMCCALAKLDYTVVTFGSPAEQRAEGSMFSAKHQEQYEKGRRSAEEKQINQRLMILDREQLGEKITAERVLRIVSDMKRDVGATRALIVVDYFQMLPVPDDVAGRGDIEQDRHRVRFLKDLIAKSKTSENPGGDAVLAITESRKPATAKDQWGQSMSDLMGSSRLAYAADGVLIYRRMTAKEVPSYYHEIPARAQERLATLELAGVVPIVLTLEKGRDGMTRGSWGAAFYFRQSRFSELPQVAPAPSCSRPLRARKKGGKSALATLPAGDLPEVPEDAGSPGFQKSADVEPEDPVPQEYEPEIMESSAPDNEEPGDSVAADESAVDVPDDEALPEFEPDEVPDDAADFDDEDAESFDEPELLDDSYPADELP